jgi:capsular polysaccharide biosynthesis protein
LEAVGGARRSDEMMVAQVASRKAARLAQNVQRQARELRLLPGVRVPTERIGVSERPIFEDAGSAASVTWLGDTPPVRIEPARTVDVHRKEFADRHEAGLPGRQMMVLTLPRASLATDGGAAITASGKLVYDTLWDDSHFERSEFNHQRRLPIPVPIRGTCASVITLWHNNYYHWLFDALPRIAILELAGLGALPLIVPEHLASYQRETLELLGYGADRRLPFTREHVRPDVLVWPSPASQIGFPSRFAVDWLRRRILPTVEASARRDRRIYLSRSLAPTRRIQNEAAVTSVLEAHGFETVRAERLTFRQQVELFSSAEAVVAPHGAGLSNILFGTRLRVLELLQPSYLNLGYYALAGSCRHDYWYLLAAPSGRPCKEADLIVPIEPLVESVEQMLTAAPTPCDAEST